MKKRFIGLLLIMVMAVSLFPVAAMAESKDVTEGQTESFVYETEENSDEGLEILTEEINDALTETTNEAVNESEDKNSLEEISKETSEEINNVQTSEVIQVSSEESTEKSEEESTDGQESDSLEEPKEEIIEEICDHNYELEIRNKVAATCTEAGYTGDTYCTNCGEKIAEGEIIQKKEHRLVSISAKAATCTHIGRIACWKCKSCKCYFSDASGKNKIEKEKLYVKALGHKYKDHVCVRCGKKHIVDTPVLGTISSSSAGITLTWTAVSGIKYYQVIRKDLETNKWKKFTAKGTSYTDTTAKYGRKYMYSVRCINKSGVVISWYDKSGLKSLRLSVPKISVKAGKSYVRIKWKQVKGATGYRIYRKSATQKSFHILTTLKSADITSFKDENVKDDVEYTYCVKAYTRYRKKNIWSTESEKKSVTFDDGVFRYFAVGNSLTLYPVTDIWFSECGMAASTPENDYVHRVTSYLKSTKGKAESKQINCYMWETFHWDRASTYDQMDGYLKKNLDLVTIQLGENAQEYSTLYNDFADLIKHIRSKCPHAQIIIIDNFWTNGTVSYIKKQVSSDYGVGFADLSAIHDDWWYMCGYGTAVYDEYGNPHYVDRNDVAIHPGDNGMAYIANAIIANLK